MALNYLVGLLLFGIFYAFYYSPADFKDVKTGSNQSSQKWF